MFQENVRPLLARLPLLMVEHVLRLEGLIDRQINRVIGIGNTSRRIRHLFAILFVYDILRGDHVPGLMVPDEPLLPFQRRRNPFMVSLAESGRPVAPQSLKERYSLGRFAIRQIVLATGRLVPSNISVSFFVFSFV